MAFNDKEIAQIIELITQHNAHLQYIGARYVPIFGRVGEDSIEWDNSKPYEPLTIVLYQGNSFTSRQFVPKGVDILNQEFWANTGNYNAQIEQYRQDVLRLEGKVSDNTQDIETLNQGLADETTNRVNADNDLASKIANADYKLDTFEFMTDGESFSDALNRANQSKKTLYVSSLVITEPIEIPMNSYVVIDEVSYTGNDYALKITDGRYGNIQINKISSSGKGVLVNPTAAWGGQAYIYIGYIDSNGVAFDCKSEQTLIECHFAGINWLSRTDYGLNINPQNGSSFGQNKFTVMRVTNAVGYALNISTENGILTGIDFGYMSLENSLNGINLILGDTYTCEGFSGNFRVYEIDLKTATGQGTVLRASGKYLNLLTETRIRFDRYKYSHVDLSGLIQTYWTSKFTPNLKIEGFCRNNNNVVIGYNAIAQNNSLVLDYVNANPPKNITQTTELDFESTDVPSYVFKCDTITSNIVVTLPKSLKPGVLCRLIANGTNTVGLKAYGGTGTETHSSSGWFYVVIDNNGNPFVYWLG